MADLKVQYAGLTLESPIIMGSCGITGSIEKIKEIEESGAGAIVLKSLFEEDIAHEMKEEKENALYQQHPEALNYINQMGMLLKPDSYLAKITEIKKSIKIPIIASLNCYTTDWWLDYAERMESAGADALELNISQLPNDIDVPGSIIEDRIVKLAEKACSRLSIPVTLKLGQNYSSLPHFINRLKIAGISGFVIFNRFYRPDIDIDKLSFTTGEVFSTSSEIFPTLRWIGILSDLVPDISYAATTGIHSAEDLIKIILAGGDAVQVCSTVYKNGPKVIADIKNELISWMEKHGYSAISDFKSLLSLEDDVNSAYYQRLQYVKHLRKG